MFLRNFLLLSAAGAGLQTGIYYLNKKLMVPQKDLRSSLQKPGQALLENEILIGVRHKRTKEITLMPALPKSYEFIKYKRPGEAVFGVKDKKPLSFAELQHFNSTFYNFVPRSCSIRGGHPIAGHAYLARILGGEKTDYEGFTVAYKNNKIVLNTFSRSLNEGSLTETQTREIETALYHIVNESKKSQNVSENSLKR